LTYDEADEMALRNMKTLLVYITVSFHSFPWLRKF
jgi:hypothetical protein